MRIGCYGFAGLLKCRNTEFPRYGWEIFAKRGKRIPAFQVVEKRLDRDTGTGKHGCPALYLRVDLNGNTHHGDRLR